ncbi:hypothetical protein [Streptomyces chryseus]|uniref:Secreted protein n=1 Tax=Streptomyces chryseus TaxID=68186 RepID=A0ABQ3DT34_9ACTN|nr:hypothetical protein [Streptomyces chryseus]GHB14148.1 hypothetical protein GCM10010346_42090 [Streptomyces chryseus]
MKLRHVRAIAVFGIAVLALTGARGRGGSCDDSSGSSGGSSFGGSSSSSSTSGGSSYDSSTSGGYTSGDTSSGSTSGYTTSSGYTSGDTTSTTSSSTSGYTTGSSTTTGSTSGTRGDTNITDVRIDSCQYDPSRGIVAAVSATNTSTTENYTYTYTIEFSDPSGATIATRHPSMYMVLAGRTERQDVATPYIAKPGETSGGKCTLSNVRRIAG